MTPRRQLRFGTLGPDGIALNVYTENDWKPVTFQEAEKATTIWNEVSAHLVRVPQDVHKANVK
jgi:hypothetical protein